MYLYSSYCNANSFWVSILFLVGKIAINFMSLVIVNKKKWMVMNLFFAIIIIFLYLTTFQQHL